MKRWRNVFGESEMGDRSVGGSSAPSCMGSELTHCRQRTERLLCSMEEGATRSDGNH